MSYKIIELDPSLKHFEGDINLRMDLYKQKKKELVKRGTKLTDFANAHEYYGMEVEERDIPLTEIGTFEECGLCGTAAVISPVGTIDDHGTVHQYAGFGPKIQKLYETLTGIQMGTVEAPEGWICEIL